VDGYFHGKSSSSFLLVYFFIFFTTITIYYLFTPVCSDDDVYQPALIIYLGWLYSSGCFLFVSFTTAGSTHATLDYAEGYHPPPVGRHIWTTCVSGYSTFFKQQHLRQFE